jgi:hypothetical protein
LAIFFTIGWGSRERGVALDNQEKNQSFHLFLFEVCPRRICSPDVACLPRNANLPASGGSFDPGRAPFPALAQKCGKTDKLHYTLLSSANQDTNYILHGANRLCLILTTALSRPRQVVVPGTCPFPTFASFSASSCSTPRKETMFLSPQKVPAEL